MKERIDFIVVGGHRSGSTTLDGILRSLPGVLMPRRKELCFFDDDGNFPAGRPPDYASYHAHWRIDGDLGDEHRLLGEVTPQYLTAPRAIDRIRAYHPGIKVISILRDPIERAFSDWNRNALLGREALSFEDAVRFESRRLETEALPHRWAYLTRSRYRPAVERLLTAFPPGHRLFLRFEDLSRDYPSTVLAIARFLGVEPPSSSGTLRLNRLSYYGGIHPVTARRLAEELRPDIEATGQLLGWDVRDWLAPRGTLRDWIRGELKRRAVIAGRRLRKSITGRGEVAVGHPPMPAAPDGG